MLGASRQRTMCDRASGNFMQTLGDAKDAQPWSLTSLREKLIKIERHCTKEGSREMYRGILPGHILALILLAGVSSYTQSAAAITITFDDLSDNGVGTPIANGYQGFNWTNWEVVNTPAFTSIFGPNGAAPGTVSAPNVAFNGFGDTAIFSNNVFTLTSAYLTAFWRDNLQVTVTGKRLGTTIHSVTLIPSATAPTLETFDWTGIDEVDLSATGGTQHPGYDSNGTEVAMDNLTVSVPTSIPEPSTLAILGGILAVLGVARRGTSRAALLLSRPRAED